MITPIYVMIYVLRVTSDLNQVETNIRFTSAPNHMIRRQLAKLQNKVCLYYADIFIFAYISRALMARSIPSSRCFILASNINDAPSVKTKN